MASAGCSLPGGHGRGLLVLPRPHPRSARNTRHLALSACREPSTPLRDETLVVHEGASPPWARASAIPNPRPRGPTADRGGNVYVPRAARSKKSARGTTPDRHRAGADKPGLPTDRADAVCAHVVGSIERELADPDTATSRPRSERRSSTTSPRARAPRSSRGLGGHGGGAGGGRRECPRVE